MGVPVLLLGNSAAGKTYSIRNLDPQTTGVFSVEKGRLPFKGEFKVVKNATYQLINKAFANPTMKTYVIDDSQYLMVNEEFDLMEQTGYQKYAGMAKHFRDLVHTVNRDLPDDVVVYFLHHPQLDADGRLKAKTIGKMIDDKLTLEGCFDIVLLATIEGDEHIIKVKGEPGTPVKAPDGMFESAFIPNDLQIVNDALRKYGWI